MMYLSITGKGVWEDFNLNMILVVLIKPLYYTADYTN